MSNLRMRSLEYISKAGEIIPTTEIAAALNETMQRVKQALQDARKDGLVEFSRDEITATGGYSLTSKGKARVKNGNMTIGAGKRAAENDAACKIREAAPVIPAKPAAKKKASAMPTLETLAIEEEAADDDLADALMRALDEAAALRYELDQYKKDAESVRGALLLLAKAMQPTATEEVAA